MKTYTIKMHPDHGGGDIEVQGEPVGAHLAVRHEPGDGKTGRYEHWSIDHIPSGYRVCPMGTREAALIVGESIPGACDWSELETQNDVRLVPQDVLDYINKYRGSHRAAPMGQPEPEAPKVKVRIQIELDEYLTARQLWPDRDWPDEITEQAVRDLIAKEGGPDEILREWFPYPDLDLLVSVEEQ